MIHEQLRTGERGTILVLLPECELCGWKGSPRVARLRADSDYETHLEKCRGGSVG